MHDKGKDPGVAPAFIGGRGARGILMDGRARDKAAAERFGRNLRKARHRAGFSQVELGRRTLLHRTHIGFMEKGERLPRVDTLAKLASALAVGADELLQGIEWVVPRPGRPGSFSIDPESPEAGGHAG